ncbi:MAG: YXWGXW repeat-containing protein [Xanthobacteraceae bacterium]|nr:YXWGXW repeat-containing protein [Xanthobacteraceae bacterium]
MRHLCALLTVLPALAVVSPAPSQAQLISITIAPPVLPVYVQPAIPAPGYIWTPGYWAYGDAGYYWVPGTWVLPPTPGLLWTPGYWGWRDGVYAWNAGYWGPTVGFYGGVNYGFGYGGVGFEGGLWRGGVFVYNRSVNNFGSVNITNVYNKTVIVNNNHVAFNGGAGGVTAQPNAAERAAMNQPHTPPTPVQAQHQQTASTVRENLASVNHGAPAVAATAKPGQFSGAGVVAAHGSPAAAAHAAGAAGAANANAPHAPGAAAANANAPHAPGAPANANAAHAPGAPAANANAAHAPANAPAGNTASHPNNPGANASLHPVTPGAAPQAPAAHPQAAISQPPAAQPRPQAPAAPRPMAAAARPAAPAARAPQPAGKPAHRG